MRKRICIVFAAMLLFVSAFAEVDLKSMTVEELLALRDEIDLEIAGRTPAQGRVIAENSDMRVVFVSCDVVPGADGDDPGKEIRLTVEWTNLTDRNGPLRSHFQIVPFIDGVRSRSVFCEDDAAEVRPGVTQTVTYTIRAGESAEKAELIFCDEQYETYGAFITDLR